MRKQNIPPLGVPNYKNLETFLEKIEAIQEKEDLEDIQEEVERQYVPAPENKTTDELYLKLEKIKSVLFSRKRQKQLETELYIIVQKAVRSYECNRLSQDQYDLWINLKYP